MLKSAFTKSTFILFTSLLFASDENYNSIKCPIETFRIDSGINQLASSDILVTDSLSFRAKLF